MHTVMQGSGANNRVHHQALWRRQVAAERGHAVFLEYAWDMSLVRPVRRAGPPAGPRYRHRGPPHRLRCYMLTRHDNERAGLSGAETPTARPKFLN
jgi:hypothetical protein